MKPEKTLNAITKLAGNFSDIIEYNKSEVLTEETPNGKYYRQYNQREAIDATGAHSKKINAICRELAIDFTRFEKSWQVDIRDIYKIRQHLGNKPFKRSKDQALQVFTISQLKGGAGKTVSNVTLSTGMATELPSCYRIGVIDLDTQGTSSMFLKPNFDDTHLSVGDLLMENYQLDEGENFQSICSEAFYPTNIPNLRVLCSRVDDREYEYQVIAKQHKATEQGSSYNAYEKLQSIINAVEDEFDIIFVDTAPQFSALTIAGHYIANSLIIPIRPSENDRDSSKKYLDFLAKMYELLIGLGHPGMNVVKLLISAIRRNSQAQVRIAQTIRRQCEPQDIFVNDFIESDAVINCAEDLSTVYDMSVSEYPAAKSSLRNAQHEYANIVHELERIVLQNWGNKDNA